MSNQLPYYKRIEEGLLLIVSEQQTCPYEEGRKCKYTKECNDAVQKYGRFEANNECAIALHWIDNNFVEPKL